MRIKRQSATGWAAAILLLAVAEARAQTDFELTDFSVEPTLAPMSGGGFAVEEMAMGDPPMRAQGGGFSLEAAVSAIAPAVTLDDAELFITRVGSSAVLTWIASEGEYILESSPALGAQANWQPVSAPPGEQRHTVSAQSGTQFFRLRRR